MLTGVARATDVEIQVALQVFGRVCFHGATLSVSVLTRQEAKTQATIKASRQSRRLPQRQD